jgi:hypothetical protein
MNRHLALSETGINVLYFDRPLNFKLRTVKLGWLHLIVHIGLGLGLGTASDMKFERES